MKNYPEKVLQDALKEVRATKDFVIVNNPKASLEDFNKVIKDLEKAITSVNNNKVEPITKEVQKYTIVLRDRQRKKREIKEERDKINLLLSRGFSTVEICKLLDCNKNYVYDENKKNKKQSI